MDNRELIKLVREEYKLRLMLHGVDLYKQVYDQTYKQLIIRLEDIKVILDKELGE